MNMSKKRLAVRLYVRVRPMSEFDKLLKRDNESMATLVCYMMFFLVAYSMILLIFSSSNPNSNIWQIPCFRVYISALASAIVVMFVYAVYRVIAQSARIWKEKDYLDCHRWEEDLSPQPFDL
uniref:Uncharacterized protein n=1 Tax=Picea sitchensis TaxID=3332 RepID=A9NY94_PICSI|nr:unknown [Picea sitchensis]